MRGCEPLLRNLVPLLRNRLHAEELNDRAPEVHLERGALDHINLSVVNNHIAASVCGVHESTSVNRALVVMTTGAVKPSAYMALRVEQAVKLKTAPRVWKSVRDVVAIKTGA